MAEQFTPWFTPFAGNTLVPSLGDYLDGDPSSVVSDSTEVSPNFSDLVSQWTTPYSEVLPEHTSPSGTAVNPEGDLGQKLVSTLLRPISGQTVDQRTQHAITNNRLRNLAVNNPLALTTYNPNSTVPDYKQGWGDPAMITGQDYAILGGRDSAQRSTAPDWWQRHMAEQYQGLQALRDTARNPSDFPNIWDDAVEDVKLNKEGVDTAGMRGVPSVEDYVNELEYQRNARNLVAKNLMGVIQKTDAQKAADRVNEAKANAPAIALNIAPPQKTRVVDTGPSASDLRRIRENDAMEARIREASRQAGEAQLEADDRKAIARARANEDRRAQEARVIADAINNAKVEEAQRKEEARLNQLNQQMLERMRVQEAARNFREREMQGQYGFF